VSAGKLDGRLYTFAARTAKKDFPKFAASESTEPLSQISSQPRDARLNHGWAARFQLFAQRGYDRRMAMPDVVDAISGEKIENTPSVGREKFGALAALVLHVHFEQIEQAHPLRVYVRGIRRDTGFNCGQSHKIVCFSFAANRARARERPSSASVYPVRCVQTAISLPESKGTQFWGNHEPSYPSNPHASIMFGDRRSLCVSAHSNAKVIPLGKGRVKL
jgi:hypothetical protein